MRTAWLAVGLLCLAPPVSAQEAPSLRAHQVTLSGGITWSGGYDIGDATAQLRGNGSGASAPPFNLFTAGSRITSAVAPTVHAGFAITPRVAIEGGLTVAHPRVAVAISGDAEASNQELSGEKLDQYQIDAALTWQLPVRMGRSLAPFVSFGGGYLRQLHEDRALAETGQVFYGGIGARYWLRGGRGPSTAIGIRGDLTLMLRRHGIDFEDSARTYPAAKLMLFVGL